MKYLARKFETKGGDLSGHLIAAIDGVPTEGTLVFLPCFQGINVGDSISNVEKNERVSKERAKIIENAPSDAIFLEGSETKYIVYVEM